MDKTVKDQNGLHLGKFQKRRPAVFQIYVILYQNVIYTSKIIFSCLVAVS